MSSGCDTALVVGPVDRLLIVGKPNSGKSVLFNRLTGLRQKVSNFPGVTVEVRSGRVGEWVVSDFPGIYSLDAVTLDEEVAVAGLKKALGEERVQGVICVLDGTRLERSLALGLQVRELALRQGKGLLFAVNMLDEVTRARGRVDIDGLSRDLGVKVVGISARRGLGLDVLRQEMARLVKRREDFVPAAGREIGGAAGTALQVRARELARLHGPRAEVFLKTQNRLDDVFLSSWGGAAIFFLTMAFLFQAIFTWAAPLMDAVESVIGTLGSWVGSLLSDGLVRDFVQDALFAGFGSFLVFVPQIFVLTLIVGILEDSGYLVRAAIICHRPLSWFGLSGRSFVPLLTGHACAIPAVMATRTIESPVRRTLTMLVLPWMACSARLPVYALLIAALVPATPILGGLMGLQGLAFLGLYVLGVVTALGVSAILAPAMLKRQDDAPFVLELPPYRLPHWRPLVGRAFHDAMTFVTKAGGMIFLVTVVVWILGYFPAGSGHLNESWLATFGQAIEPWVAPLGLDWRFGVAILSSFLAREVFVGTLGTLLGIEETGAALGADDAGGLVAGLQSMGLTPAAGVGLLVFYALALQCVATLAVVRKETASWRLPLAMFVGYSALAYVGAWLTYRILSIVSASLAA